MRKITFASIVPLIGGESIGLSQALDGALPEYVLSYSPFKKNDSHYIEYLRSKGWEGEYRVLDTMGDGDMDPLPKVDIINAVCPCAGLSSLSVSSNAESDVNDWLYMTAEHVLGIEQPTVFFGENAPRLFTEKGKPVVDRLMKIGEKHGYVLMLYATKSQLHGLAQKRPRTFYFFFKGNEIPIFPFVNKPYEPIEVILKTPVEHNDPMNIVITKGDPFEVGPWLRYCMHKTNSATIMDYYNTIDSSISTLFAADRLSNGNFIEIADWFDTQPGCEKAVLKARSVQLKLNDNKGYWGHGAVTVPKGLIGALIGGLPYGMINIYENRFLTIRECLRIMKMPDDFNLIGKNPLVSVNHICQNVPVSTARDMSEMVKDYINGEYDGTCITTPFMKINNNTRTVEYESDGLSSFF